MPASWHHNWNVVPMFKCKLSVQSFRKFAIDINILNSVESPIYWALLIWQILFSFSPYSSDLMENCFYAKNLNLLTSHHQEILLFIHRTSYECIYFLLSTCFMDNSMPLWNRWLGIHRIISEMIFIFVSTTATLSLKLTVKLNLNIEVNTSCCIVLLIPASGFPEQMFSVRWWVLSSQHWIWCVGPSFFLFPLSAFLSCLFDSRWCLLRNFLWTVTWLCRISLLT